MTAGDVLARLDGNSTGQGVGLRGGSFRVVNGASAAACGLERRFAGPRTWRSAAPSTTPRLAFGVVRAALRLTGAGGVAGEITVEWPEGIANSMAAIRGSMAGAVVTARAPRPEPSDDDEALNRLVAQVKKTTHEATTALDAALEACAESNRRIAGMEAAHAARSAQ